MYRVLIVDDEFEIRNGLFNFSWEEIGFIAVGMVENGKEALDFIKHNHVDVVLCDVRMPVIDGIEFARKIRESEAKVKIVFLSGYKDFEYVRQAMKYGGKDYLLKPTKFRQLVDVFKQLREELDNELMQKFVNNKESAEPCVDRIVDSAMKYINEHLAGTSLEDTANFVKFSPQYFSKYFKEKTGVNFSHYLMEQRMNKAATMLKDARNKTYEVAYKVGYSNPKNFTRAFKNFFGLSPHEYRKHIGEKDNVKK